VKGGETVGGAKTKTDSLRRWGVEIQDNKVEVAGGEASKNNYTTTRGHDTKAPIPVTYGESRTGRAEQQKRGGGE